MFTAFVTRLQVPSASKSPAWPSCRPRSIAVPLANACVVLSFSQHLLHPWSAFPIGMEREGVTGLVPIVRVSSGRVAFILLMADRYSPPEQVEWLTLEQVGPTQCCALDRVE